MSKAIKILEYFIIILIIIYCLSFVGYMITSYGFTLSIGAPVSDVLTILSMWVLWSSIFLITFIPTILQAVAIINMVVLSTLHLIKRRDHFFRSLGLNAILLLIALLMMIISYMVNTIS